MSFGDHSYWYFTVKITIFFAVHHVGIITADVDIRHHEYPPDVFFSSLIRLLSETELPGAVVLLFVLISHVAHCFSASTCVSVHPAEWKNS